MKHLEGGGQVAHAVSHADCHRPDVGVRAHAMTSASPTMRRSAEMSVAPTPAHNVFSSRPARMRMGRRQPWECLSSSSQSRQLAHGAHVWANDHVIDAEGKALLHVDDAVDITDQSHEALDVAEALELS